jgi:hypothetical protein
MVVGADMREPTDEVFRDMNSAEAWLDQKQNS